MLGGALGAAGRHWLGGLLLQKLGDGFPWGTFAVNMLGSFAIGFLAVWLEGRGSAALYWRAFLIVGVLGALTTWSSLMLECLLMARGERMPAMAGYLLVSLLSGLALVWAGARIAGLLRTPAW